MNEHEIEVFKQNLCKAIESNMELFENKLKNVVRNGDYSDADIKELIDYTQSILDKGHTVTKIHVANLCANIWNNLVKLIIMEAMIAGENEQR